jgi:hypothetical protein
MAKRGIDPGRLLGLCHEPGRLGEPEDHKQYRPRLISRFRIAKVGRRTGLEQSSASGSPPFWPFFFELCGLGRRVAFVSESPDSDHDRLDSGPLLRACTVLACYLCTMYLRSASSRSVQEEAFDFFFASLVGARGHGGMIGIT